MRINTDRCQGCRCCLEYCPAGAIKENPGYGSNEVYIDEETCFECGLCRRVMICPENAFEESEGIGIFPRIVRAYFSDPNTTHKLTLVPGRGTEESKTNDVTGRIKRGEVGICIEFGRPGIGSTFQDISLMTSKLKTLGVRFEPNNPLTELMDPNTGEFVDALLPQHVLSAILELRLSNYTDLACIMPIIIEVSYKINTVFSLSVISRFEESGELPILEQLTDLGITFAPNAKINLGLGKPLAEL